MSDSPLSSQTLSGQTLADFVNRLGSTTIAPGSGAAGAVALALAAGCMAKAFAISYHHTSASGLREAADHARGLATIALECAQRDGDDFRQWLESHSAPAAEALRQDAHKLRISQRFSQRRRILVPTLCVGMPSSTLCVVFRFARRSHGG